MNDAPSHRSIGDINSDNGRWKGKLGKRQKSGRRGRVATHCKCSMRRLVKDLVSLGLDKMLDHSVMLSRFESYTG
jgi:hypothetical protein